jgi:hypothetical protein
MNSSTAAPSNTDSTGFRTQQKRGGNGYRGRGRGGGYRGGRGGSFQRNNNGGAGTGSGSGTGTGSGNRFDRYKKTAETSDAAPAAAAAADTSRETSAPVRQYPTEPNFAVTRYGALGLYNVLRRPVIFYANQWEGIRSMIENGELSSALELNADKLRRPSKREEEGIDNDAEDAKHD